MVGKLAVVRLVRLVLAVVLAVVLPVAVAVVCVLVLRVAQMRRGRGCAVGVRQIDLLRRRAHPVWNDMSWTRRRRAPCRARRVRRSRARETPPS